MVKIGDKLKSLRSEKKMTQRELAEKLNVSAQAVSRWENDEVEPSLETLGQLATSLSMNCSEKSRPCGAVRTPLPMAR